MRGLYRVWARLTGMRGDGLAGAPTLVRRAASARRAGRLQDAHRDYAAAVASGRESGAARDLVQALKGLGQIERDMGHGDNARPLYEEAVAICRTLDDPLALAHTVRHLGDLHQAAGRLDLAEPCYEEALRLYRGDSGTSAGDLANAIRPLAILTEATGRSDEARRLWRETRDLYATVRLQAGVEECETHLAKLDRRDVNSPMRG